MLWHKTADSFLSHIGDGALLGIDYGRKSIGLAVSDIGRMLASPLTTIDNNSINKIAADIVRAINERNIVGIIVGYPLESDGKAGGTCQRVRQFMRNISAHLAIPYIFQDESFSTSQAQHYARGTTFAKTKSSIDSVAASIILQDFINLHI